MKIRTRKNRNLSLHYVGSFLILIGIIILAIKLCKNYSIKKQEDNAINEFLKINHNEIQENIDIATFDIKEEIYTNTIYNYIAVLEIPKINLKHGLFDINDKNNTVDKSIEILNESDMPNIKNGILILAGHSGYSQVSFFDNLYKLNDKDLIYIYYKNIKYIYEVSNIERQDKTGKIEFTKSKNTTELILTTCDPNIDKKQLIIKAKLIDEQQY